MNKKRPTELEAIQWRVVILWSLLMSRLNSVQGEPQLMIYLMWMCTI